MSSIGPAELLVFILVPFLVLMGGAFFGGFFLGKHRGFEEGLREAGQRRTP